MNSNSYPVHGAGLGLRRSFMDAVVSNPPSGVDFMEVAPENWIGVGGVLGKIRNVPHKSTLSDALAGARLAGGLDLGGNLVVFGPQPADSVAIVAGSALTRSSTSTRTRAARGSMSPSMAAVWLSTSTRRAMLS